MTTDTGAGTWSPVLAPELRSAAVEVAREVAARVTDRDRIAAAVAAARQQTGFPMTVHWQPAGIAQGDAGLALLCACLDRCFPDEGWDRAGHGLLTSAGSYAERNAVGPSLYGGLAGLGFAAAELSRGGTRYGRLLEVVDRALVPQAVALAGTCERTSGGMPVGVFDAISGIAGVGAHLLGRRGRPEVDAALERLLTAFVGLGRASGGDPPRWFTPAADMPDAATAAMYPDGHLNCGLAHGIPGPLALAALALAEDVEVPGLRDAVERTAEWLCDNRADDAWGVNWPTMVPLGDAPEPWEPSRAAWCYGSPGVARALWLAGRALGDGALMDLAAAAMEAVERRPVVERRIDSPTFCHGVAGLLQITLRFARDTGRPGFAEAATALVAQLLDRFEPDSLLGFRSLEPDGVAVDQPGLLDGAPGVALVLLAAATDREPTWDRLFLLS